MDKKKAEFGSESLERTRIVIVDPRRTVTVNACEVEAGKDNVMHLALNSGTDLVLFNAWMTYIADKGWTDKAFIDASTTNFDKMRTANKVSLEDAAKITGLSVDQIRKSAEWIGQPKAGNARRRTMFAYEKGLIWGNDNYRTNGALVNVALATGNTRDYGARVRSHSSKTGKRPATHSQWWQTPRAVEHDQIGVVAGPKRIARGYPLLRTTLQLSFLRDRSKATGKAKVTGSLINAPTVGQCGSRASRAGSETMSGTIRADMLLIQA
jgi:Molybdopterin oxidoreductase